MDVNSPEYRHMMAQIPLELIHKTQAAKEIQMNVVEKIRERTEQSIRAPQKALAQSYEGHNGTYGADGRKTHIPQVEAKRVDIQA
jgi:hypothetical protein